MLGRQPVVDREHRHIELPRQLGAKRLVRVEIAEHEAAAVEEQDSSGPASRASPRVEQPQRDLARRAGAGRSRITASSPVGASAT